MKSFNSVNIWSLSPKRYAHTGIPTIATLESISNANDLNQPSLHWKLSPMPRAHDIYHIYTTTIATLDAIPNALCTQFTSFIATLESHLQCFTHMTTFIATLESISNALRT